MLSPPEFDEYSPGVSFEQGTYASITSNIIIHPPSCRQSPLEGLSQVRPTDEEEPHEMNQKGGAAASSMRPALAT